MVSIEQLTTAAFLGVSCVSLVIQAVVLHDLRRSSSEILRRPLVRTSASRVFCAILYVIVGFNGIVTHWHIIAFTFTSFLIIQAVWWVNAWLDRKVARNVPTEGLARKTWLVMRPPTKGERMFNLNRPVVKTGLDEAIDEALIELKGYEASSDQYAKIVSQLTSLNAIHKDKSVDRISKDTLALVLGNLAGILVIVGHERAHIVTSKALSFVGKFK